MDDKTFVGFWDPACWNIISDGAIEQGDEIVPSLDLGYDSDDLESIEGLEIGEVYSMYTPGIHTIIRTK